MRIIRQILLFPIRVYQVAISPMLGPHCRFAPTCSCYTIEAVEVHGVVRGGILAVKRILRCHPWHPGGYDPVPASDNMQAVPDDEPDKIHIHEENAA